MALTPTKRVASAFQDVTGVRREAVGGVSKRPLPHSAEITFARAGRRQVVLVIVLPIPLVLLVNTGILELRPA